MSRTYVRLIFFNQTVFDTLQFVQFIGCMPILKVLDMTRVVIEDDATRVNLSLLTTPCCDIQMASYSPAIKGRLGTSDLIRYDKVHVYHLTRRRGPPGSRRISQE